MLFEGSDRPRGPSPLGDGPQFPVGLEAPAERFGKDLGDTVPVLVVSIRHQSAHGLIILAPLVAASASHGQFGKCRVEKMK